MASSGTKSNGDAKTTVGGGGETHQTASAPEARITTNHGVPVSDDQNSLKAGPRGPSLLEDFVLREKIQHFDHERIPERIVHSARVGRARLFRADQVAGQIHPAKVLTEVGKRTEVFTRFSTVAGGAGSVDTPRDVRGFAVKLYTVDGNWDLVGNNIPVFFIQDGIKFPDLIHAVKPEPDRELSRRRPVGPRHVLGLRIGLHAREHAHAHVGDVGPCDPQLATARWRASASTRSVW